MMKKERQIALNSHFILFLFFSLALFLLFLCSLITNEIIGAIFFFLFFLLGITVTSFLPIYIMFSETEITIIYFWKTKERISWDLVKYIEAGGSWFSKEPLPYYRIIYPTAKKKPFFISGEIPRTKKTRALLNLYWKNKIRGEKKIRNK